MVHRPDKITDHLINPYIIKVERRHINAWYRSY